MQFFHTIPFAIIALISTGLSWGFIGMVMSDAPRKKCDVRLIMLTSYLLTGLISLAMLIKDGGLPPEATFKLLMMVTLNDMLAYILNFGMQYTMSFAMQAGPNGLIWGIVQSATVFPFITGMFLGDETTVGKICGILLLLLALAIFSFAKDNSVRPNAEKIFGLSWKAWAFISFAFTAFQQTFSTLPSYFSDAVAYVPISYRLTVAGLVGALCALGVMGIVKKQPTDGTVIENLRNWNFWILNIGMLIPLLFAELYLMYPALNILAPAGMGGIGYPIMVGACIVFFTIISWTYYREKFSWKQLLAVLVCLGGLCLLCE